MTKDMKTFEEFKNEIFDAMKSKPKGWRDGQFVFNYVDEVFGVARAAQFIRKSDCFYDDTKIDEFIRDAYDEYVDVEQSYEEYAFNGLDYLYEEQKTKELEFYRKFIDYIAFDCTGNKDYILEMVAGNEYNEYLGDFEGEWVIRDGKPHISLEVEGSKLTFEWYIHDNYGVWQQNISMGGDSYQGYLLFPKGNNKYFVVKFKC